MTPLSPGTSPGARDSGSRGKGVHGRETRARRCCLVPQVLVTKGGVREGCVCQNKGIVPLELVIKGEMGRGESQIKGIVPLELVIKGEMEGQSQNKCIVPLELVIKGEVGGVSLKLKVLYL